MASDTGVDYKVSSLLNRHVLFVISGGIAAVESIKLLRELRRHSAKITIIMTKEAEKIISPLAISWAANEKILSSCWAIPFSASIIMRQTSASSTALMARITE